MQTIHLHARFYCVDKAFERLSEPTRKRWNKLRTVQQLESDCFNQASVLEVIGLKRFTYYHWLGHLMY